jgi:hypothetical protein
MFQAWHLFAAILVLVMVRRQSPTGRLGRITGVLLALVVFAASTAPTDAVTGHATPTDTLWGLVAVAAGLGFIIVAFNLHPE